MRKFLLTLVVGFVAGTAFAAAPVPAPKIQLVEGKDYTVLTTAVNKTPEPANKINVKEFFSFTCIHCKDIEPLVEKFIVTDKRIDLSKVQVVWGDQPVINSYAKLNATIQSMNLNRLNVPVFTAVFANQDLTDTKTLKTFLGQNGLKSADVNKFMNNYNSFSVAGKVGEYKLMTANYNVTGTPTFVVADKYVASPAQPARLIQVVEALVDKASAEAKVKK